MLKVLNLYAGIGGNRRLWKNVEVTAIENNKKIAEIYHDFFPDDKVIIADAHDFLLKHFMEFDFIWSSPPCPTHSKLRQFYRDKPQYIDIKLYQEIILLKTYFKGLWVVENVVSYYEPLIKPYWLKGHYFWSNFVIPENKANFDRRILNGIKEMQKDKGFDLTKYKGIDKRLALRNCVESETALEVFNWAFKDKQVLLDGI